MFKIKICGVTRRQDLEHLASAGADAVGINRVASSPRCVTLQLAKELVSDARSLKLQTVVVVMNPSEHLLAETLDEIRPDALQLHGHEQPELLAARGPIALVKAISWTGRNEEKCLAERWAAWARSQKEGPSSNTGAGRFAFLVDAFAPGVGGGTGRVARWDLLNPKPPALESLAMLLAGGLTSHNVAQAIAVSGCEGVDTASGVESSPGIKDAQMIRAFVSAAREAFQSFPRESINLT